MSFQVLAYLWTPVDAFFNGRAGSDPRTHWLATNCDPVLLQRTGTTHSGFIHYSLWIQNATIWSHSVFSSKWLIPSYVPRWCVGCCLWPWYRQLFYSLNLVRRQSITSRRMTPWNCLAVIIIFRVQVQFAGEETCCPLLLYRTLDLGLAMTTSFLAVRLQ